MSEYNQAIVLRACPLCGSNVLMRWSPTLNGGKGFVNARCTDGGCATAWYAGSYADCPVSDFGKPRKALEALIAMGGKGGRGAVQPAPWRH